VADPADRRAKLVRLTARGRAVDDTVRAVIRRLEDDWAANMGAEDYAELTRLLRRLIAMLEEKGRAGL
jgi:DNA-binding MarR family transcriptional regulator